MVKTFGYIHIQSGVTVLQFDFFHQVFNFSGCIAILERWKEEYCHLIYCHLMSNIQFWLALFDLDLTWVE